MRLTPTNADARNDADLPVDRALTQSICPNRRGRRFSGARLCEPRHVYCLVLINLPHASCLAKLLRVTDSRSGARLCEPQHVESDRRAGFVRTVGRATTFSLPLLLTKGGEGRGEEALFINSPPLRLSPRSFLAGRERKNARSVLLAVRNWPQTRAPLASASPCCAVWHVLHA